MTALVLWTVLGVALLLAAAWVVVRIEGTTLGPYSTRLVAIAISAAAYYGSMSWSRHVPGAYHAEHWRVMHFVVPVAAGAAALYCLWRILQSWQSELHGLLRGVFKIALVVALVVAARLSFSQ